MDTLADAVRQAAEDACKEAVQAALKPKGADAKVQRLESDNKALRDRLLQLKDMEQCQRHRFADLSNEYAKSTAESAQLKAENERAAVKREGHCPGTAVQGGDRGRATVGPCSTSVKWQSPLPVSKRNPLSSSHSITHWQGPAEIRPLLIVVCLVCGGCCANA